MRTAKTASGPDLGYLWGYMGTPWSVPPGPYCADWKPRPWLSREGICCIRPLSVAKSIRLYEMTQQSARRSAPRSVRRECMLRPAGPAGAELWRCSKLCSRCFRGSNVLPLLGGWPLHQTGADQASVCQRTWTALGENSIRLWFLALPSSIVVVFKFSRGRELCETLQMRGPLVIVLIPWGHRK